MDRRTYLSAFGISGLAGCGGLANRIGGGGIVLSHIYVENMDTDSHTIRVLVRYDGKLGHWSASEVPAFDAETGDPGSLEVERTWPDKPGKIVVNARLDDEREWRTENLSKTIGDSCTNVHLSIDRDGNLTVMFSGDCGAGATTSS